jgi:hypothetical protein
MGQSCWGGHAGGGHTRGGHAGGGHAWGGYGVIPKRGRELPLTHHPEKISYRTTIRK